MQKLSETIKFYRELRIKDPGMFTMLNLFIVTFVAFVVLMNLPTESHTNYVKKDVLPASCSGFEGVEVDGRKYYCVDFWWKEVE